MPQNTVLQTTTKHSFDPSSTCNSFNGFLSIPNSLYGMLERLSALKALTACAVKLTPCCEPWLSCKWKAPATALDQLDSPMFILCPCRTSKAYRQQQSPAGESLSELSLEGKDKMRNLATLNRKFIPPRWSSRGILSLILVGSHRVSTNSSSTL